MDDLISRRDAINAIDYLLRNNDDAKRKGHSQVFINGMEDGYFMVRNNILQLPSAYPETDSFCTDCKEYDQDRHFCPRFDRVIKKTVEEMGIIHCKDCKHGELFTDQYLCHKDMLWREGDFYCKGAERWEEMNKQRKVVITTTYNDLGVIIDTKAEELDSSAQPEQSWIPCSERLPEKSEQVLIYARNVHYVLAKYKEIRTWEGIYKMAWVMEDAYNAPHEIKHDVIAWMPLPKPPKEGRHE